MMSINQVKPHYKMQRVNLAHDPVIFSHRYRDPTKIPETSDKASQQIRLFLRETTVKNEKINWLLFDIPGA
jgi:hypothetical protein